MSASLIFDIVPLGSLVAYSDGQPKPPARFTKKLAAWKSRNGVDFHPELTRVGA